MIDQATLIAYLAILLGFVFIPGPAVLLTLTRATTSGTKVGIATGIGIAIGDLKHVAFIGIHTPCCIFLFSHVFIPKIGTHF